MSDILWSSYGYVKENYYNYLNDNFTPLYCTNSSGLGNLGTVALVKNKTIALEFIELYNSWLTINNKLGCHDFGDEFSETVKFDIADKLRPTFEGIELENFHIFEDSKELFEFMIEFLTKPNSYYSLLEGTDDTFNACNTYDDFDQNWLNELSKFMYTRYGVSIHKDYKGSLEDSTALYIE